jgi:hypothetical protein
MINYSSPYIVSLLLMIWFAIDGCPASAAEKSVALESKFGRVVRLVSEKPGAVQATLSVAFSASFLAVCAMMVSFGVGWCGQQVRAALWYVAHAALQQEGEGRHPGLADLRHG